MSIAFLPGRYVAVLSASLLVLCSCSSGGSSDRATDEPILSLAAPASIELKENELLNRSITGLGKGQLIYSLSGTDRQMFSIDPDGGALSSTQTFDFEHPADSDGDGIFHLVVELADETGQQVRSELAIVLVDVQEPAFTITYPTPNANLGGLQTSTVIAGQLMLSDGSTPQTEDGVQVAVNGTLAAFDPAHPGRWSVEVPVGRGANDFNVALNIGTAPAIEQPLRIFNDLLLNEVGLFDFDSKGAYSYGLARAVNAVIQVTTSDWSAETLFTFPFRFNGVDRCEEISEPLLDEIRNRLIFVCEDMTEPNSPQRGLDSLMTFDLEHRGFQELLPAGVSRFSQATIVDDKHLLLYTSSSVISWLDLDTLDLTRYNLQAQPEQSAAEAPFIVPARITADGRNAYIFSAPSIYVFDASSPIVVGSPSPGVGGDLQLTLLDPELGRLPKEVMVTHYSILYSKDGAIYEKSFATGAVELVSDAYADQDHLWSGRLLLNKGEPGAGILLYDEGSGTSFQITSSGATALGNADIDPDRLPNVTHVSLNSGGSALMTFSFGAKQINHVDLGTAVTDNRGNFASIRSRFGVGADFDYSWITNTAYFCAVFDWRALGNDNDIHVFSLHPQSAEATDLLNRGTLANYFNVNGAPYRLRTTGIVIDEDTGRLLLSVWGGEGTDYSSAHFESLFWFNPGSEAIEEIERKAFSDGQISDSYIIGHLDAKAQKIPLARWTPGSVAVLDLASDTITPAPADPAPVDETSGFFVRAPALDIQNGRILVAAYESNGGGIASRHALLHSFDLSSGHVSVLDEAKWPGMFRLRPWDIVMDNENSRAFIVSEGLLIVLDPITGARAIVTH